MIKVKTVSTLAFIGFAPIYGQNTSKNYADLPSFLCEPSYVFETWIVNEI